MKDRIGETITWTYKGKSAAMTVTPTNWGVAAHMSAKVAIENAYATDAFSRLVMQRQHGLHPVN